jgi:hypothetical protein
MSKELRRMAAAVKAILWINLVIGTLILSDGVHYRAWSEILNGAFLIGFAAFACPFMLRVINGKS